MYTHFVGSIPEGLCVLHKCDNPICCRPDHLFLGTQKDNVDDMMAKGRQNNAIGEAHPKSKLTEHEVRAIKIILSRELGYGVKAFLASWFDISRRTIGHIDKGTQWKHI